MSLDNVTLRAATLDDLTGIAAIYNQLWCNTLRNRGDVEAADFCGALTSLCSCNAHLSRLSPRPRAALSPPAASASSRTASRAPTPRGSPATTRCSPRQPKWQRLPTPSSGLALRRQSRKGHGESLCRHRQRVCPGPAQPDHHRARVAGQGARPCAYRPCARQLAKAGCTKFFLMSDCNSDWQFYEHLNMKRILRITVKTPVMVSSSTCTEATRRITR